MSDATATPLITCSGLSINVAGRNLIKNLSCQLKSQSSWAILGQNGTGKTHLLHTIAGLYSDYSGKITLNGKNIQSYSDKSRARNISLLLQNSQFTFPGTVLEYVLIGRHPHIDSWRWENSEDIDIATQSLTSVGLNGFEQRNILTLSGGEVRRMEIARLLCQQSSIMLLDEPVNHLDWHQQHRLLEIIISQPGAAKVMVLHDANLATRYCDNSILLYGDGRVETGTNDEMLTEENLSELYRHEIKKLTVENETLFMPQSSR